MDVQNIFEYPLPIINKDVNKIIIETSKFYQGNIVIKNDGEGTLEGRIMTSSNFLSFDTEYFTGNYIEITYTIDLGVYNTDNKIVTEAFIMSNGGEHIIEFFIKRIPYILSTEDGHKIITIKDFFSFSKKNPYSALSLFKSHSFKEWLNSINYEYIDLYIHFLNDPNIERGIDSFFILNKLKYKPTLSLISDKVNINLNPYINKKYMGFISIKRSGQGYIEDRLLIKNKAKWLKIEKEYITSADFKSNNTISIGYSIDESLINKKVEYDTLLLEGGEGSINVTVSILNYLNVCFEKDYMDIKDTGYIIINNYSEDEVYVELVPKDSFLKFEKVIYKVGRYLRVSFNVKLSPLQIAQRSLKKRPIFKTEVLVTSYYKGEAYKKNLNLVIGNFI